MSFRKIKTIKSIKQHLSQQNAIELSPEAKTAKRKQKRKRTQACSFLKIAGKQFADWIFALSNAWKKNRNFKSKNYIHKKINVAFFSEVTDEKPAVQLEIINSSSNVISKKEQIVWKKVQLFWRTNN